MSISWRCMYCGKKIDPYLSDPHKIEEYDEQKQTTEYYKVCKKCRVPIPSLWKTSPFSSRADYEKLREYYHYSDTHLKPIFKPTVSYSPIAIDEKHGLFAIECDDLLSLFRTKYAIIFPMNQLKYVYGYMSVVDGTGFINMDLWINEPSFKLEYFGNAPCSCGDRYYEPPKDLVRFINVLYQYTKVDWSW